MNGEFSNRSNIPKCCDIEAEHIHIQPHMVPVCSGCCWAAKIVWWYSDKMGWRYACMCGDTASLLNQYGRLPLYLTEEEASMYWSELQNIETFYPPRLAELAEWVEDVGAYQKICQIYGLDPTPPKILIERT